LFWLAIKIAKKNGLENGLPNSQYNEVETMSRNTCGITPGTVRAGCLTDDSSADGTVKAAPPAVFLSTILLAFALILPGTASALTAGKYFVDGNPNCNNLHTSKVISGPDTSLLELGPLLGFKYDASPTSDVSSAIFDNSPWLKTSGQADDLTNTISIFNVVVDGGEGKQFDWSSTLGLDAVIVKGGPDANAYVYTPEAFAGSGLVAPGGAAVSHIEFCYDYNLQATKTANAEYTRTYTWEITKDFDATYNKFIGDPATKHDYKVSVDQTVTDSPYTVSGTITVTNPTPYTVEFEVSDSVGGTPAIVNCPKYTLNAGGDSTICTYSVELGSPTDGTNIATIISKNPDVEGTTASDDYAFGAPKVVGYPTINVTDDKYGSLGSASGDRTFNYSRNFECSKNPADYTDGIATQIVDINTATITETKQSDDATVTVNCYAPVISKDAAGSYDVRYEWTIEKTVTDPEGPFYPGDEVEWTWTIDVTKSEESESAENIAVTGTIEVTNPSGSPRDITVSITDELDDGTTATLTCGGSLTVSPGNTETCDYTADPDDTSATENTATGTFNSIEFIATADVAFELGNVFNNSALVSDPEAGLNNEEVTETTKFTFDESEFCSNDWADYDSGTGKYTIDPYNKAEISYEGGTKSDDDDAETSYTCEAGTIDVLKYTEGVIDDSQNWKFALYIGPDGFNGNQVGETSSTLGDADGILDFSNPNDEPPTPPALNPTLTYTVCELEVPAGWSTAWSIEATTVIPYNPNEDDDPPEDLGNRCFDVGATTSYPVAVGGNLRITVDNTFPGGDPRTPGYWKNWSSCSNGGQFAKTTPDVDPDNEFVSLDEVLTSPGISWNGFVIYSCELAVSILDQRDFNTGRKRASDAAYTLAMHLLAAQLNFGAGAESCEGAQDAALAAENLLVSLGFHAEGKYLRPKDAEYQQALDLAHTLDQYNNGYLCENGDN
jgi:hypothetical protein